MKQKLLALFLTPLFFLLSYNAALAVPVLQLYMEGGVYDQATESWVMDTTVPFNIWVIGNLNGEGGKGSIYDVKLSAAVATSELGTGSISLTPMTTSLVNDPSTPSIPTLTTGAIPANDGETPLDGYGNPISRHGTFGPGVSYFEWLLGDFISPDSPIGDFMDAFPSSLTQDAAQINVYQVMITGFSSVHFDAYDHYVSKNGAHYKVAPYSHDAFASSVPEPATLFLLGTGLAGLAWVRRKK